MTSILLFAPHFLTTSFFPSMAFLFLRPKRSQKLDFKADQGLDLQYGALGEVCMQTV
jgi:hypothetical protein